MKPFNSIPPKFINSVTWVFMLVLSELSLSIEKKYKSRSLSHDLFLGLIKDKNIILDFFKDMMFKSKARSGDLIRNY